MNSNAIGPYVQMIARFVIEYPLLATMAIVALLVCLPVWCFGRNTERFLARFASHNFPDDQSGGDDPVNTYLRPGL